MIVSRLPTDPSTIYVKRIVALAGDRIVFREGRAFVNGTAMAEPYIKAGDPRSIFNNTQEFTAGGACVRRWRQSCELDGQPRDHAQLRAGGKHRWAGQ